MLGSPVLGNYNFLFTARLALWVGILPLGRRHVQQKAAKAGLGDVFQSSGFIVRFTGTYRDIFGYIGT